MKLASICAPKCRVYNGQLIRLALRLLNATSRFSTAARPASAALGASARQAYRPKLAHTTTMMIMIFVYRRSCYAVLKILALQDALP